MNEKHSRALLFIEAGVVAAPLTLMLAVGIVFAISNLPWPSSQEELASMWPEAALVALIVLAGISAGAGWRLMVCYLAGGVEWLRTQRRIWWVLASIGAFEVLAAVVSRLLPPSVPYSPEALFRDDLEGFLVGAPLLAPLAHLWLEMRFRSMAANKSMQPTCEDARG
jgi:hypothetical protein